MTTPSPMAAAVIIPHFNDTLRLERCLEALMPQVDEATEVVVVDNGSTQPLEAVRLAYPQVRIVIEPAKGAAFARNRGVAETTASLLFFLDCDCLPSADWLATAYEVANEAQVVGGRITLFDETPAPRSGAEAFETVFAFDNRAYIATKGFSVTANLLTSRAIFDAVGPFRSGLSEDLDWCRRATATGYVLHYDARLSVAHPTRSDWAALRRKWQRLTEEAWGLAGTSLPDRGLWALRALAMPLSILIHTPRVLRSPRLAGPGERLAALGTLVRLRFVRCGWMVRQAVGTQSKL